MTTKARVLIADDNPDVRADLIRLLNLVGGVDVVGEAECGSDAAYKAEILEPDIIIIDMDMGKVAVPQGNPSRVEMDGCAAIPVLKARHPRAKLFVLTVHGDPETERAAFRAGADAYFVKGKDTSRMFDLVKSWSAGE